MFFPNIYNGITLSFLFDFDKIKQRNGLQIIVNLLKKINKQKNLYPF